MNTPRASFSVYYKHYGEEEIIVAGGYVNGKLTTSCEVYSVAKDQWREFSPMNYAKASCILGVIDSRYLYCIGGVAKDQSKRGSLTNIIECIDLYNPVHWNKLSIGTPMNNCDFGCIPVSDHRLLIYGGWNNEPHKKAFTLRRKE